MASGWSEQSHFTQTLSFSRGAGCSNPVYGSAECRKDGSMNAFCDQHMENIKTIKLYKKIYIKTHTKVRNWRHQLLSARSCSVKSHDVVPVNAAALGWFCYKPAISSLSFKNNTVPAAGNPYRCWAISFLSLSWALSVKFSETSYEIEIN